MCLLKIIHPFVQLYSAVIDISLRFSENIFNSFVIVVFPDHTHLLFLHSGHNFLIDKVPR